MTALDAYRTATTEEVHWIVGRSPILMVDKAKADAAIKQMQVCGNCDHNGGSRCCEPRLMEEDDNVILVGGGRGRCRFIEVDGVSRWVMSRRLPAVTP